MGIMLEAGRVVLWRWGQLGPDYLVWSPELAEQNGQHIIIILVQSAFAYHRDLGR